MNRQEQRMSILREVAYRADIFYEDAERLGQKAALALTRKKRSQITGLEGVANSALKTSDVFDFIKIRTARHKEWRQESLGRELLAYMSGKLRGERQDICITLNIESQSADGLRVHLLLIREFVRQLSAQYEYKCEFPEEGVTNGSQGNT